MNRIVFAEDYLHPILALVRITGSSCYSMLSPDYFVIGIEDDRRAGFTGKRK
ncbi:MAG TPA: hypothetical protein VF433_06245 [Cellvibrio sp.]